MLGLALSKWNGSYGARMQNLSYGGALSRRQTALYIILEAVLPYLLDRCERLMLVKDWANEAGLVLVVPLFKFCRQWGLGSAWWHV